MFQAFEDYVRFKKHAGASAERAVVHSVPIIIGIISEIDMPDIDKLVVLCSAYYGFIQHCPANLRKETDYVQAHVRLLAVACLLIFQIHGEFDTGTGCRTAHQNTQCCNDPATLAYQFTGILLRTGDHDDVGIVLFKNLRVHLVR